MTTINIDVPTKNADEYKQVLSSFAKNYSVNKLKEIKEKVFYLEMLDGVFDDKENYKEIKRKNGKLDFNELKNFSFFKKNKISLKEDPLTIQNQLRNEW